MLNCKIVFLFKNIDNDKIMKFLIILIIPIKVNRWGGKTPDYACSILAVTIILIILYPYFWVSDESPHNFLLRGQIDPLSYELFIAIIPYLNNTHLINRK